MSIRRDARTTDLRGAWSLVYRVSIRLRSLGPRCSLGFGVLASGGVGAFELVNFGFLLLLLGSGLVF